MNAKSLASHGARAHVQVHEAGWRLRRSTGASTRAIGIAGHDAGLFAFGGRGLRSSQHAQPRLPSRSGPGARRHATTAAGHHARVRSRQRRTTIRFLGGALAPRGRPPGRRGAGAFHQRRRCRHRSRATDGTHRAHAAHATNCPHDEHARRISSHGNDAIAAHAPVGHESHSANGSDASGRGLAWRWCSNRTQARGRATRAEGPSARDQADPRSPTANTRRNLAGEQALTGETVSA